MTRGRKRAVPMEDSFRAGADDGFPGFGRSAAYGTLSAVSRGVTPGDAAHQAKFLARCAREYGATWGRQSSQRYAGELVLRTAYSSYRVIDGRCIVVQRAGSPEEDDEHECLGTSLVGYLLRHDDADGPRWSLHKTARAKSKAVFWRPTRDGNGHFVVTSRLDIAPDTERTDDPPQALTPAAKPTRTSPPPLPVRATPKRDPWTVATPTAGVLIPTATRAPKPPGRPAPPPRVAARAPERKGAPPPPPPRCMKRNVGA